MLSYCNLESHAHPKAGTLFTSSSLSCSSLDVLISSTEHIRFLKALLDQISLAILHNPASWIYLRHVHTSHPELGTLCMQMPHSILMLTPPFLVISFFPLVLCSALTPDIIIKECLYFLHFVLIPMYVQYKNFWPFPYNAPCHSSWFTYSQPGLLLTHPHLHPHPHSCPVFPSSTSAKILLIKK